MKILLKVLYIELTVIFVMIMYLSLPACLAESNTAKQDSKAVQMESGTGKDELLKWFRNNMKYASAPMFDFMQRREEQINECIKEKIACKWLMGSAITNSGKGYIVSFKDNKFTIDEFPAGKDADYGITDKDMSFKKN